MIVVAGHVVVDPDHVEDYLVDCVPVVEAARRAEGCLDFALSADLVDPQRINVYECWASQEALEAFRGSGPSDGQTDAIREADVREFHVRS